jgi:hypothetical protein
MTKLKPNITMSLDGHVAGPNQDVEHPFGAQTGENNRSDLKATKNTAV